jgi:MFS family permease
MNTLTRARHNPRLGLILLAFIAFIALGLPDGLLGVGWPSIRAGFGVPLDALGLLLIASVAGYMTSSFLSGTLLARFGVGRVLVASCALTGTALLGYTLVPQWWMMVLLGVGAGLGLAVIPASMGLLAQRASLEIIPVYLLAVYVALLGCYSLAMLYPRPTPAAARGPVG